VSAFNAAVFYAGSGEQMMSLNVDMCTGKYLVGRITSLAPVNLKLSSRHLVFGSSSQFIKN